MPNEMDGVFDLFLDEKFKEFGVSDLDKLKYKTDLVDMDWLNGATDFKEWLEKDCLSVDDLFEEWKRFIVVNNVKPPKDDWHTFEGGALSLVSLINLKFISDPVMNEYRSIAGDVVEELQQEKKSHDAEIRRICDELNLLAHERNVEAILKKIRLFTKNQDSGKL